MKNVKKLFRDRSGFSLIEVMIAAVILAGGLLALASLFTQGTVVLVNTSTQLAAKELANSIIEDYFIRRDLNILGNLSQNVTTELRTWNGRNFNTETDIRVDSDGNFRIIVTVFYQAGSATRSYTTTTIL